MIFHQLSEGRSLRWHGVPTLPHDHVPETTTTEKLRLLVMLNNELKDDNMRNFICDLKYSSQNAMSEPFLSENVTPSSRVAFNFICSEVLLVNKLNTYSSWVQLAGLSIRCPSFSSLKSSSTGIPGYGEPPSVKISHNSTP